MALEVVGGALLSASLQVLFADIHCIVDFVRRNKVNEELLKQLENKLLSANGVLDDAERQQITKLDVREWLQKLKDAIHDAEDLEDEIKTEALRCQHKADRHLDRVRNFFSSRSAVKDVEPRIENIIKSVDGIVQGMKILGLRKVDQTSIPSQRAPQNSLVEESDVYGREHEKEAIIKFLSSDGGHKISVMTIVGMAGIGKTTLAQLVYTGKVVMEKHFDIKEWITVADESKSDVFTLTKAIYEKVPDSTNCTVKETFQLQLKLKEALQGKKFLFVFDDVWNVDRRTWELLQKSFESAANGSKIIVTTRLPEIAKNLATPGSETLDLALLSDDDGWKLFSKHAFSNVKASSYPHLEEIGKKIVEKCGGNPLAVRSLACLLYSRLNRSEWERVLVNDIWELEQGEGDILPALWLSYYYLPRHLKRCFAYCSIIPKDFKFEKEKLILLWMAENLLQPQNNTTLEEVGEKYFEDLTSRSFFIVDEENRFTMHDLVNDLAKFVSGESCMRLGDNCSGNLTRKTRHISCLASDKTSDIGKQLKDLSKEKVLRTFLVLKGEPYFGAEKQYNINPKELRSMQCLRVLSASRNFFPFEGRTKLFKSIGSLKLLRYLDLSYNQEIKEIPDTICKLYNLQTLLLVGCENLVKFDSIGNLKQLRHLDLSKSSIEKMPDTICNLHELRTLSLSGCKVLVKLSDSIGNLKQLRHLDLSMSSIEKIPDTICNLHELRTLSLSHCYMLTQLPTNISMLTNLCKLDNTGTSLNKMPPKISNLKNLRSLPEFVVGKINDIEELGELPDLHGPLWIRSLENVEEVSKAILKNKNQITRLELQWNYGITDVSHDKAREVLDRLQPHTNIKELSIRNYGGRSFPDWIGHHSFSCIREVLLYWGKNCDRLPPLGELPSLEDLQINGFDMVERIGDEFYLNDSSSSSSSTASCVTEPPFKSLKNLVFEDMGGWKEWSLVGGAFPNLKTLQLEGCPGMKSFPPLGELPSLEDLQIKRFSMVERIGDEFYLNDSSSSSSASCVTEPPFKSLKKLVFEDMGEWKEWSMVGGAFPNLKTLQLSGCPGMKSFPPLGELPSLEKLTIKKFDVVERIGDEFYLNDSSSSSSSSASCVTEPPFKSLKNLVFEDMGEWKERSLVGGAFPNLKTLLLIGCTKLKGACLPDYLPSLEDLWIQDNYHAVASLSTCQYPSLRELKIVNCPGMMSFPQGRLPSTIQTIRITECDDLESLSEEGWPCSNLKSLYIGNCEKLFAHSNKWNLGMLTSLTSLRVYSIDMEGVDSFPEEEGQLPTTLTSLGLFNIKSLKSLNGTALRHLTSLRSLTIWNCEQLQCLAEERLPASLSEFGIRDCPLLKPRCQRGIGQDWDKIHHISYIWIDYRRI